VLTKEKTKKQLDMNSTAMKCKSLLSESFQMMYAHANSRCARRVTTIQNLCHTWVIFMATHFLCPQIGVSVWNFRSFSSQVKIRHLRAFQVFTII